MTFDKASLRKKYLAARENISRDEANAASVQFAHNLLDAIPVTVQVIAAYRPMRGEIDMAGALPELIERGHTLCLPVVVEKAAPLIFRRWHPGEALEKGQYGVEVPLPRAEEVIPDALIVPLVAFDSACHRIGYGAGYYDRTIRALRAQKKNLLVIGAAYSLQQAAHIPAELQDEKLDRVVTEEGLTPPAVAS